MRARLHMSFFFCNFAADLCAYAHEYEKIIKKIY